MKRISVIILGILLPVVSFAQNYTMKFGDRNFESDAPAWLLPLMFLLPVLWFGLVILLFIFWLIMLIDAIKHSPEKMKTVWVLVIIFTQIIGAIVYYFVEKKPRNKLDRK